jgi:glycosyltransferase involved in cell wall biosynthesis
MDVEGYGIVFLEAAICGLPSIGSNSGGIPDAIENNKSGFLVEEGNVDEISSKLEYLFLDKTGRETMGNYAKKRAKNMTWERMAEKIYAKIEEVVND